MSRRRNRKRDRKAVHSAAGESHRGGDQPAADGLSDRSFYAHLALAFLAGSTLRLAFINTQILLDDEWHGMDYAIGNSVGFLLTHFSVPGATSIPLNVYTSLLLQAGLWNETLLRLPALVPGIAALVGLPWLVRKAFGRTTTVVFAWLLAISPFLIFYSRIARPYGMVTLAGAATVLWGYLWLVSGRRGLAVLYVASGVIAAYFHLLAAVSVAVPALCGLCFRLVPSRSWRAREGIRPSYRQFAAVVGIFAAVLGLLLGPAIVNAAGGTASSVVGAGAVSGETAVRFASMLAGTSNAGLIVVFWAFLLGGLALLYRSRPLLATVLGGTAILYFVAMLVTGPELIRTPLVLSRYVIGLFPLALALVSYGIVETTAMLMPRRPLVGWHRVARVGVPTLFLVALFALGPIPHTYYRPNNFTAHSAFLESYAPLDWSRSYHSDMTGDVPVIDGPGMLSSFYQHLAVEGTTAIIEFPMFVGNHFNLYYYYQHFHKKRVLAGFFPHFALETVRSSGWVYGNYYVDYVMSREHNPDDLRMANMVDVSNPDGIRRSGAGYIVLHRHLMTEMSPRMVRDPEPDYPPIAPLVELYGREFGQPVFQDANLVAFRIGAPTR